MMIQACAVVVTSVSHTCSVAAQLLGGLRIRENNQAYAVVGAGTKSVASRGLA
jgi:hypothetical protein